MKKTIQINLAGTVFHIDDDAYEILRRYINSVERKFSRDPGGSEVLNDLESRMAELFSEKLTNGREVIHAQDVREVLEVMGAPADMGDHDRRKTDSDYRYERRYRRMYRDPDDKPIGGVCSGLAYYFNTDPLLIRILFVIGFFVGFGLILYLVLWIALPMADTPEEIEEMRSGSSFL